MKKVDLEKNKGMKIIGRMKQTGTPGRYGKEASAVLDRREQRRLDQSMGLVPFAVKLDSNLVKRIQALAQERQTALGDVVAELLKKGLSG